jgi:hypothetical protein
MTINLVKTPTKQFSRSFYTLSQGLLSVTLLAMITPAMAPAQAVYYYGNGAGTAYRVSIATLGASGEANGWNGWIVTAVENGSGNPEAIVWHDTGPSGGIVRTGSTVWNDPNPGLQGLAIADLDATRVVTVDANHDSELELIVWEVSSTGSITIQNRVNLGCCAGPTSIARLDSSHVATATTQVTGCSCAAVNVWEINSAGSVSAGGSGSTGVQGSGAVAITAMNPNQFVTAIMNYPQHQLELNAWGFAKGTVTHQGSNTAGGFESLAMSNNANGNPSYPTLLSTAVVNNSGNLELIFWDISATGVVTREYSGTSGPAAGALDVVGLGLGALTPVASSSNGGGQVPGGGLLYMDEWYENGPPTTALQEEASTPTTFDISQIAAAYETTTTLGGTAYIVVTAQASDNLTNPLLTVIVWGVYPCPC